MHTVDAGCSCAVVKRRSMREHWTCGLTDITERHCGGVENAAPVTERRITAMSDHGVHAWSGPSVNWSWSPQLQHNDGWCLFLHCCMPVFPYFSL